MKGNEADKYPCEKHYDRKKVTSTHVSDIAAGVMVAGMALVALSELEGIDINPGMVADFEIEIPEDMVTNMGDLLGAAGEVCGSAMNAAGEFI